MDVHYVYVYIYINTYVFIYTRIVLNICVPLPLPAPDFSHKQPRVILHSQAAIIARRTQLGVEGRAMERQELALAVFVVEGEGFHAVAVNPGQRLRPSLVRHQIQVQKAEKFEQTDQDVKFYCAINLTMDKHMTESLQRKLRRFYNCLGTGA